MKLSFALLLAPLASAWQLCGTNHHPSVMSAIGRFCQKTDMVVPSSYASNGVSEGGARVWIEGNCSPPQWVPSRYCMAQFNTLCENDETVRRFGNGGCQSWHVSYAKPAAAAPAKPPNTVVVHL